MIATAMKGKAPYRQVLTHGFTVDGQGRKMSKSIGNTISPQDVMNKLGVTFCAYGWHQPTIPVRLLFLMKF